MTAATRYFNAMAANNVWANYRLLAACARLDQAAFEAPRVGFFPSLQATLNHILVVDWFYVDGLAGGRLGPAAWAEPLPCPTVASLQRAQAEVDRRLLELCAGLAEADLAARITLNRGDHDQVERCDRVLLHLFQHQIHHRGQAHAMLAGTMVAPPQLDEFFPAADAPLRAADLAALGWAEAKLWQDLA